MYIDKDNGTASITFKQVGSWCGNNYCIEGNAFNGNRDGGLWLKTNGAVTVAFYQARDNWGTGHPDRCRRRHRRCDRERDAQLGREPEQQLRVRNGDFRIRGHHCIKSASFPKFELGSETGE